MDTTSIDEKLLKLFKYTMVLIVGGYLVENEPSSISQFYSKFPKLTEDITTFLQEEVSVIDSDNSLFIAQGEYAIVPGNDTTIKVVGSDDATTCHILILLNKQTGTVSVSHLDNRQDELQSVEVIISTMKSMDFETSELDVYVIGGYSDISETDNPHQYSSRNCSHKIGLKLLHLLIQHQSIFNLRLWCSCCGNTIYKRNILSPMLMGLAYNRITKNVIAAHFPVQTPCIALRSAAGWANPSDSLVQVYDHNLGHVVVDPFEVEDSEKYKYYSSLPDSILRKYFSTSPLVEPISFSPRLKETFSLLGSDGLLFPENTSKQFKLQGGSWKEL